MSMKNYWDSQFGSIRFKMRLPALSASKNMVTNKNNESQKFVFNRRKHYMVDTIDWDIYFQIKIFRR